mgnify:CR=1 FL=1
MPLPKPQGAEDEKKFMSRCMGDSHANEKFPDNAQRSAVCYKQFRGDKKTTKNNTTINKYTLRKETLNGRAYLVAPVVLITEGVHNGSDGAIYYPFEELSRYPEAWNGRYVPVDHPNENGIDVSVNSPIAIEKWTIGQIFNCKVDEVRKALVAEIWIDEKKTKAIAQNVLDILNSGTPLEVSTGLFFDAVQTPGKWNNEEYVKIAINIQPDHLAVLPGKVGACSWKDGCGVRNKSTTNLDEISHKELRNKIEGLIHPQNQIGISQDIFLESVFDTYFIWSKRQNGEEKLYRQEYSVAADGKISLEGEGQEVAIQILYNPVNNKKGGEKRMPNKKEDVDFILNVKQMEMTEADREFVANMEEKRFATLKTYAEKFAGCKSCNGVEEKKEPVNPPTFDEMVANAAPEIKEMILNGVEMAKKKKSDLVNVIKANKKNRFSDVVLNSKPIAELEAIVDLMGVEVDFSLQAGSVGGTIKTNERQVDGRGVPDAPVINWAKK